MYKRQECNKTWAIYEFSRGKKEIKTIFNPIIRKIDTLNSSYITDSYVGHRVYVVFYNKIESEPSVLYVDKNKCIIWNVIVYWLFNYIT